MIAHNTQTATATEDLAEALAPAPGQTDQPVPSSPCGRPRALNLEGKRFVVQLLIKGFTLTEAAGFMACDRDTILNERKRDPLFDRNVRRAKAMRNMNPMEVIRNASRTSWRAAAWLIEHRMKAEQQARKLRQRAAARRAKTPQAGPAPDEVPPNPPAPSFSAPAPVFTSPERFAAPLCTTQTQENKAVGASDRKTLFRRRSGAERRPSGEPVRSDQPAVKVPEEQSSQQHPTQQGEGAAGRGSVNLVKPPDRSTKRANFVRKPDQRKRNRQDNQLADADAPTASQQPAVDQHTLERMPADPNQCASPLARAVRVGSAGPA